MLTSCVHAPRFSRQLTTPKRVSPSLRYSPDWKTSFTGNATVAVSCNPNHRTSPSGRYFQPPATLNVFPSGASAKLRDGLNNSKYGSRSSRVAVTVMPARVPHGQLTAPATVPAARFTLASRASGTPSVSIFTAPESTSPVPAPNPPAANSVFAPSHGLIDPVNVPIGAFTDVVPG
ncbi:hypothetical protein CMV30_04645 [Nibricoccus aquaticus]|uniref:Uncharacterized protein n=1 Tax=Nibricoccus aquaticus TaxID=2576891 RepID=A0A290Q3Q4_9BACT|nr:hypothetical protein CMV30_04645 [Nibricoccus aquaticus]